jgi:hypothetical protein
MPASPLFAVSRYSREIEYVARYSASRISTLVAMQLPPALVPDIVRIKLGTGMGKPPQWPMVVSKIILVMLAKGKSLDTSF